MLYIIRINNGFGGNLIKSASLDYALDKIMSKKLGFYKKLAYLWRAILVDHPFTDGNKRTAIFIAFAFAEEQNKIANRELLIHRVQSIASRNINNIRNIETRLKNAIR